MAEVEDQVETKRKALHATAAVMNAMEHKYGELQNGHDKVGPATAGHSSGAGGGSGSGAGERPAYLPSDQPTL